MSLTPHNYRGWTELMRAAYFRNFEAVKYLLEQGADPNVPSIPPDCEQATLPIHYAALFGKMNIVELLLERGAVVDGADKHGRNAIHYAADDGYGAIVKLIAKNGVAVDFPDDEGATALHYGAVRGGPEIVKLLLSMGAAVDAADGNGKTALHKSCRAGREIAGLLIENGANVNASDSCGRTTLHHAAEIGDPKLVSMLLNKGARPEVRDLQGRLAGDIARNSVTLDLLTAAFAKYEATEISAHIESAQGTVGDTTHGKGTNRKSGRL